MREVWIVVDGSVDATGKLVAPSPTLAAMVAAFKEAIATHSPPISAVKVVSAVDLMEMDAEIILLCPFTLNLPTEVSFSHRGIYQICQDTIELRHIAQKYWGCNTGTGSLWLPVVWTAKGPLYAEAIGLSDREKITPDISLDDLTYSQPVHLSDAKRQMLYELAHGLLKFLAAPPATYLLQFDFEAENLYFDRLWPFPAPPAIASLGIQSPNLFTCHWHCLTNSPIYDIKIVPTS